MLKVKLADQKLERKRALGRERARAYPERLNLNPDKLKETREKANLRKRKYRERSEEKRATHNAKQVIRQQRHAEKKSNNSVTPPITRTV